MTLRNQRYSMGGSSTHKKMLNYDFDTDKKEISNLKIYEGMMGLEDGIFLPDRLTVTDVLSENEIRDSLNGLKAFLSQKYNIKAEEINVFF